MKRKLRSMLSDFLTSEDASTVYNSYDIVGDIAIVRLTEASKRYAQDVAEAIARVHKNVKTVLAQIGPVAGGYRLRKLEHVFGEVKTSAVHRESNCLFAVDVQECYFSPRLFFERLRIASLVEKGEVVVNMFAGVGSFSVIIAKQSRVARVYSIDLNPEVTWFMRENVRLNRVYGKVVPMLGDAKEIITNQLQHVADRVLMPLPEKALEYLPSAVSALKPSGGWIHYYGFEHAKKTESPTEKVKLKMAETLAALGVDFEVPFARVVRSVGPNWFQIAADVHVM